jgi:hypothetical protein
MTVDAAWEVLMRDVFNCAEEPHEHGRIEKPDRIEEPGLRFPVTCPLCARELLCELPIAAVARALALGSAIRLHASCHDVWWDATAVETAQVREYFSAARLMIHQPGSRTGLER